MTTSLESSSISRSWFPRWTAEKKLKIVLETLQSDQKLAEICRREGISPTQVYHWRKQLLGSAEAVFGRKQAHGEDRRVAKLAIENQRGKNDLS